MNGVPLPLDHGFPLRLVVPGWYGCTCIKWVDQIGLLDDTAPATSQMKEFAGRTHQPEAFELAREYLPATIEAAAMPIRVERWQLPQGVSYRVVGIRWGGDQPIERLSIQFGERRVGIGRVCAHRWRVRAPGRSGLTVGGRRAPGAYAIRLRVGAPTVSPAPARSRLLCAEGALRGGMSSRANFGPGSAPSLRSRARLRR